MKDKRSQEIKVGIVSLLGIILLIAGIMLGKGIDISSDKSKLRFIFPESNGIKPSEPIVVNGVERGSVEMVKNTDEGVYIEGSMDKTDDIYKDATAKITILEITGGRKIEINPGNANGIISLEDTIKGTTPPDIPGLIALFGDVGANTVNIIKRIDSITYQINTLLQDPNFKADIRNTVSNASTITDDLRQFSDNNLYKIENSLDNIYSLSNELKTAVTNDTSDVRQIIRDLKATVQNTKELTGSAKGSLKNADKLISELNSLMNDIKQGNGTVSKILYDEKFAGKLDSTLINLHKFIKIIEQHGVNVNVRLGTRP